MKRLMQLVVLVCSLFIMTASAFAASSVIDTARILTTNDRMAVEKSIAQVEQKYGVRAAFVTIRDSKVTDLGKYANTLLDRNYRDGRNGNMVYVVNMATSKFYVADDNKMRQRISDSYGVNQIANNVAANLKDKKYKAAVQAYASQLDKQLSYYQTNGKAMEAPKPTTTNTAKAAAPAPKKEKGHNIPMAAGGAVLAGGIGAFVYGGSLKSSMSNVANAARADQYMKPGSFKLSEKDDTFMYFTYTRTPKPKKNTSNDDERDMVDNSSSDDNHGGAGGGFGDDED